MTTDVAAAEPADPPPPAATEPDPLDGVEGTARAPDGLMLRTLRWVAVGVPWAAVLLVHGLGEHCGRYRHVGRRLAEAGIGVYAYDQRGFGGSAGPRAFVERWSIYHDDLESRLAAARAASPDLPLVLYGHSMGGQVTLGYVLAEPPRLQPDRLVLTSPSLDATIPEWKRAVARTLSRVTPRMRLRNDIEESGLSHDPAIEAAYAADPLNLYRSTVRLGAEAFREQARIREVLGRKTALPVVTYVVHGDADPIVPVSASAVLEGRPNVTRRVYPSMLHETHNEPEGLDVIDDTIAWLRGSLGARAGEPGLG